MIQRYYSKQLVLFDNQGRVVIDRSRYESVNNDYTLELSISRWLYESLTENPEIESIN